MIKLTWQNAMPAAMARKKHHFPAGKCAVEQLIGSCSEWRFYSTPFPVFKAFNIVQAAAANDADAVRKGGIGFLSLPEWIWV